MTHAAFHFSIRRAALAATLGAAALAGCKTQNATPAESATPMRGGAAAPQTAPSEAAAQPSQARFDSPEAAAAALKEAVRLHDRQGLLQIFGPDGRDLVFSGDPVQENNSMDNFERHMAEQLRVDRPSDDKAVLYIGAENWPFPIPLARNAGQWSFDTLAGRDEILNRRIGRNELDTIDVCQAYVRAQNEYARRDRDGEKIIQYARRFRSHPGKHDGLYWEPSSADDFSPMGSLVAEAEAEGYSKTPLKQARTPYHGYFYKILTAQGSAASGGKMDYLTDDHLTKGFALIAYPAKWGDSGVMTFIVNRDGKVYQKDLGPQSLEVAAQIKEYDPDPTWKEIRN